MKKTLLTLIALLSMSFTMAQSSSEVNTVEKTPFGGISYCFIDHGMGLDMDLVFLDFFVGFSSFKESGIDIGSDFWALSFIYPDSFEIGKSFFIAPTVGAGYYHNTTTTKISGHSEKSKSGAFDFLLSPKAGFIIPINNHRIQIFANYRYDALNFKFQGKGIWGIGIAWE